MHVRPGQTESRVGPSFQLVSTCESVWSGLKFDLDQSDCKLSQVNASACKAWPNWVASRPRLSTGVYLRLRLARAKHVSFYTQIRAQMSWNVNNEHESAAWITLMHHSQVSHHTRLLTSMYNNKFWQIITILTRFSKTFHDLGIHLQVPESFVFWVTWD